uniref:Group II intron reverse transcriptase/maturase n=1 Tax=Compsopogon caeruleus TaxID=31354 RepID=A0A1Z1XB90_9RHOD|nr:group II intron reverse transcriptase/maturase [Compsopogon caeruleus]ARX96124.1 group II intron reverse transcriptase/maturase [Compsopogon caeruleus]
MNRLFINRVKELNSDMNQSIDLQKLNNNVKLTSEDSNLLDWDYLPWKKIKKFVFLFQKQIYSYTVSNHIKKVHKIQHLLSQSYAIKLLALSRSINYFKKSKIAFNKMNSLNSRQKLYLAQNLNLFFTQNEFVDEENSLNNLVLEAKRILIYFCLRPEWEAKFELSQYNMSLNINIQQIIKKTVLKLKNHNWEADCYILTGVIETYFYSINKNYLFEILNTIPLFWQYIDKDIEIILKKKKIFEDINISNNQITSNTLLELIAQIILFKFSESIIYPLDIVNNNSIYILNIMRYRNNFIIITNSLKIIYEIKNNCLEFFNITGLKYNSKKTKIFTNQEYFNFLGYTISNELLVTHNNIYQRLIILPTKEEKKLILAKIRYILRNKHKNGKTRARTNMPLSKAILLINPLVKNWKSHYINFIPQSVLIKMDSLLNEKIYRWYIKRLKKNRVHHWNTNCIQIINGNRRISDGVNTLELFSSV